MFGHTLLRIDPAGEHENTPLLGYALNFAAHTHDPIGLSYAYKGIFGKYEGKFSLASYSTIVKQYGDLEHRDIWEFPLNLSDQEIFFLLLHLCDLD